MALKVRPTHGYPNWTALVCDSCGATISEGENPERAVDTAPERAILVRRIIITKQGTKHESRDYCGVKCQWTHGIYSTDEKQEAQP